MYNTSYATVITLSFTSSLLPTSPSRFLSPPFHVPFPLFNSPVLYPPPPSYATEPYLTLPLRSYPLPSLPSPSSLFPSVKHFPVVASYFPTSTAPLPLSTVSPLAPDSLQQSILPPLSFASPLAQVEGDVAGTAAPAGRVREAPRRESWERKSLPRSALCLTLHLFSPSLAPPPFPSWSSLAPSQTPLCLAVPICAARFPHSISFPLPASFFPSEFHFLPPLIPFPTPF